MVRINFLELLETIDYSQGKIYSIWIDHKQYVGSTADPLKTRMGNHYRHAPDLKRNGKMYQLIRERGGWHDVEVEVIENYPCDNKEALEDREKKWIIELKPELNIKVPRRTKEEYKQTEHFKVKKKGYDQKYNTNNKDKLKEYNKKWREANKENVQEKSKKYREDNKEKIKEKKHAYHENQKGQILAKSARYDAEHPEETKRYKREWYNRNKETIKNSVTHCGICNVDIKGGTCPFRRHTQSKRHIEKSNAIL
jgi:hypothetical protein